MRTTTHRATMEYPAKRNTPARHPGKVGRMAGFFYAEVLVAVVLIALALVPAMDALLPAVAGSVFHKATAEDHYELTGKLEQVLAEPFANLEIEADAAGMLTIPTSYSEAITYPDGRKMKCYVYLSRYDGDNADADNNPFTGTDKGLLWVQVTFAGASTDVSIESLVSDYD